MKNKKLFAILTLVCFMMTLMPVAAFAAVDPEVSAFAAKDGDQSARLSNVDGVDEDGDADTTEGVKFVLDLFDKNEEATTGEVYIWATNANGTVTSAMTVVGGNDVATISNGNVKSYKVTEAAKKGTEVMVQFSREGKYTVYAAKAADVTKVGDLNKFSCTFSTINVKANTADPDTYKAAFESNAAVTATVGDLNSKKKCSECYP